MKKIGLILTLLITVAMVVAITVKLSQEDTGSSNDTYKSNNEAGKLSEGMIGVTPANYDEKITNSKGIVVIDYYAPTCSYCVKYTPVFASVFEEYKDRAAFGKYDVTSDSSKITALNIEGTPATIIFKDGKEVGRIGGYVEADVLKQKIEEALK